MYKRWEIPKGKTRMDNLETLESLDTQDTERRQKNITLFNGVRTGQFLVLPILFCR